MDTGVLEPDEALIQLHATLNARLRPESVALLVWYALKDEMGEGERRRVGKVAGAAGRWNGMTSLPDDFAAPVGGANQVAATSRLFDIVADVDADAPASLLSFAHEVGAAIGFDPRRPDFLADRLNRHDRAAAGMDISKRQYNRRFRALRRVTSKAHTLDLERGKRHLTLLAKTGFATELTLDRFRADPDAACFIAYFTAKRKLRREFTLSGRANPFDEIAELLFARCRHNADTDWWMIAQAYPTQEVLARLTEEQRGELLGRWFHTMRSTASALEKVWTASEFDRERMIVRRGNDSSTWNLLCGAYNAARAAWLSCLAATDATGLLEVACPGKAMMLIAGDLAAWHIATGSGLHPDTQVWAALPLPWEVLDGRATCTAAEVTEYCEIAGIDPHRGGWTGPKPPGPVGTFRPTRELVHGVAVADPLWASMLRGAGAFSGKPVKATHAQELSRQPTGHPHPN
ncbi:hypothetical protein [Nocardia sp. AG03]|uniref:hypothetical protein n=1 Tax=Nocardia sp. AG03 TaxID=3025312 RepID=UPI0024189B05|nr:hypothetical protein [Nocardia sp. AG03]